MAATTGKKIAVGAIVLLLLCGGAITLSMVLKRNANVAGLATPASAGLAAATSSGVKVELVAVSTDAQGKPWWTPSGQPTALPYAGKEFRWSQENIPNYPQENRLQFVVRTTALSTASQQEPISIEPLAEPGADSSSCVQPSSLQSIEPDLAMIRLCWKTLPQNISITIGVAAGPWKTLAETKTPSVRTKHRVRVGANGEVEFTPPTPFDGRPYGSAQPAKLPKNYSQFELKYSPNLWKYGVDRPLTRLVALGADGHEYFATQTTVGVLRDAEFGETVNFQTPPGNIVAVRFQARPYEPVQFKSISLRPGLLTQPSASLKPVQGNLPSGKL